MRPRPRYRSLRQPPNAAQVVVTYSHVVFFLPKHLKTIFNTCNSFYVILVSLWLSTVRCCTGVVTAVRAGQLSRASASSVGEKAARPLRRMEPPRKTTPGRPAAAFVCLLVLLFALASGECKPMVNLENPKKWKSIFDRLLAVMSVSSKGLKDVEGKSFRHCFCVFLLFEININNDKSVIYMELFMRVVHNTRHRKRGNENKNVIFSYFPRHKNVTIFLIRLSSYIIVKIGIFTNVPLS